MRSWNVAAAGAVLVMTAAIAAAAGGAAGQSGTYPGRMPAGAPLVEQRFEIPWPDALARAQWAGPARRLGVTLKELTPADAKERRLPSQSGVLVEAVQPQGPAEKSGIKPGDIIIKINGELARSIAQVRRLVNETAGGQAALVGVFRDGKTLNVSVAPEPVAPSLQFFRDGDFARGLRDNLWSRFEQPLPYYFWSEPPSDQGRRPNHPDLTPGAPFTRPRWPLFEWSPGAGRLGVIVQELGPQLAEYFKVKGGALVASVTPGSPAAQAGLRAGDVVTAVDGKDVKAPEALLQALRNLPDGKEATLSVVRAGKPLTVKVKLTGRGAWHA